MKVKLYFLVCIIAMHIPLALSQTLTPSNVNFAEFKEPEPGTPYATFINDLPRAFLKATRAKDTNTANLLRILYNTAIYLHNKIENIRTYLKTYNLSIEQSQFVPQKLSITTDVQPTYQFITAKLDKVCDLKIILLFMPENRDEAKNKILPLNRYLTYCQKWVEIIGRYELDKDLTTMTKHLIALTTELLPWYQNTQINGQPLSDLLGENPNSLSNQILITFYATIAQAIKRVEEEHKSGKLLSIISNLKGLDDALKLTADQRAALSKQFGLPKDILEHVRRTTASIQATSRLPLINLTQALNGLSSRLTAR
jgi:hypothetical protein